MGNGNGDESQSTEPLYIDYDYQQIVKDTQGGFTDPDNKSCLEQLLSIIMLTILIYQFLT